MSSRFNPAQDPERFYYGGNPDPEDDPWEHEEGSEFVGYVEEAELLDDLADLGMWEEYEAVMFTPTPRT